MKRIFLFLILLMSLGWTVHAQELKFRVAECYQDQQDRAAQGQFKRDDGDGQLFAVIKVTSDLDDDDLQSFQFDFNYNKHERTMRDGELWLYVQYNAKKVTIRRDGYKTVKYDLPFTIKDGATYRMKLSVQRPIIVQRGLQFKVTDLDGNLITGDVPTIKVKPADSSEDYDFWGAVDNQGTKDRLMETGVYLYEINASNYKTATGSVSLVNGEGTFVETVKMTPNFGFLEIADEHGISGAEVYINNAKVGTVPYKSNRMECRDNYQLMITNGELYKTYNATFAIQQGKTTKLSPRLESNFAETTIKVDGDAEIFINGDRKGRGSWTGPLKAGVYNIECRLTSHVSTQKQITVKPNEATTFIIEKPKPIEGSIYVTSTPSGAQIYIDGKNVGQTPSKIDHVIIGSHKVTIRLTNHRDEVLNVDVREGETETVNITLSDIATMTFKSNPSNAALYIDGKYKGDTPYTEDMPSGEYDIKVMKDNCRTFHKRIHLDGSNPEHTFRLAMQYQLKRQLYIQPTIQVGKFMGVGMAVGGYLGNFNLEGNFLYGMGNETIYWIEKENPDSYVKEEYKNVFSYGGKVGYGFVVGTRLRITPQLGGSFTTFAAKSDNSLYGTSAGYVTSGSIGVRVDYALLKHFGVVFAPEYGFPIGKSDVFKTLSPVSSKIKGYGGGFNCRLGINVFF